MAGKSNLIKELILELAEIYSEYFDKKHDINREKLHLTKPSLLREMNDYCEKAITYYTQLLELLTKLYQEEKDKTIEDFASIVSIKLNIARLSSKIAYKEVDKRIGYLRSAYNIYEEVNKLLLSSNFTKQNENLRIQLKLCEEMIYLLPSKISKIQRGELI